MGVKSNKIKLFAKKNYKLIKWFKRHLFFKDTKRWFLGSYTLSYLLLGFSYLVPRNKKIWVFGSFLGAFNDNAKYLFIYIVENHPEIRPIWISDDKKTVNNLINKGFEVYYKHSLKGYFYTLIGKNYFFNVCLEDINVWTSGGATKINLWHGIPIKKIGFDVESSLFISNIKNRFLYPQCFIHSDYVLSTSQWLSKCFASAFKMNEKDCIELGYPRNKILSYPKDKVLNFIQKYEHKFILELVQNLKKWDKIFVYMPTYRDTKRDFIKEANLDFEVLNTALKEKNRFLILKFHHHTKLPINLEKYENLFVFKNIDIYPILPFTDCLITDYSSIFFDYKLMKKEVILFPFDKDEYVKKDREMYYSYDCVTKNQNVANSFSQLVELIKSDVENKKNNKLLEKLIFQTKEIESSKEIVKIIQD